MQLKEIREERGLSQRQAALGLNLSPTVYNRYENGLREPSNAMLIHLADYFNVTTDALLGREPVSSIPPAGLDKALVDLLVSLPAEQVQRVIDFVQGMKAART